jgi:hypothetical protein
VVKNLTAKKPQKAEQFPAQPCGISLLSAQIAIDTIFYLSFKLTVYSK